MFYIKCDNIAMVLLKYFPLLKYILQVYFRLQNKKYNSFYLRLQKISNKMSDKNC